MRLEAREVEADDVDRVLRLLKPTADAAALVAARDEWTRVAPGVRRARLVVGRPAVGYVEVIDRTSTPKKYAETSRAAPLVVDAACRRQGVGSALLAAAEAFARDVGTPLLQAETDDPAGHAFAAARGFAELTRRQSLRLDLAHFDGAALASAADRPGVRVVEYADAGDTADHRRRLFDVYASAYPPGTYGTFDAWSRSYLDGLDPRRELLLVAIEGDAWIGLTRATLDPRTDEASTHLTAVVPSRRGRGVGAMLKWHALVALRDRGARTVVTGNRVDNAAIQAINARFGFAPEPPSIVYRKRLW